MPVRRLDNGELIQVDLSHYEDGRRRAVVYGVGFRLRRGTKEYEEAREIAQSCGADEVEILS